jgi:ABC-2 type transport system permease protein
MPRPEVALARRLFGDARVRTLSFSVAFAATTAANGYGYTKTYPHLADRLQFARTFGDNKAARLFYGVPHDLTTVGGYTAWRAGGILAIFAGVLGIFASTRAIRGEEESGRSELVLAGALSRVGAFVAALLSLGAMLAIVWFATGVGLLAGGLPFAGSWYLALAVMTPALVYVGVGCVAAEIMPTRRSALGTAGAVLGIDFILRVVADTVDVGVFRWFIPLGWAEELRPFSGSRAAVLILPGACSAVLLFIAARIHAGREVGAGLVAARDTAPPRLRLLSSPTTFAFRLERIPLAVWTIGVAGFAFVVGTVAKSVAGAGLSAEVRRQIAKFGGIDIASAAGYVGLTFLFFVLVIGLFACSQLSAARGEESSNRLETLFALPYGRLRWLGGRLVLATAAVCALAASAGAGVGLGAAATGADLSFGRALEAGLNCVPAALLLLGVGVLLFAALPRYAVGLMYAAVAASFLWELVGALVNAPAWALDLSPFHHIAPVPAQSIAVTSAVVMLAIGASAALVGVFGFRARDLATE